MITEIMSIVEENAKMIIEENNLEMQYNIIIDNNDSQKIDNLSPVDMHYIKVSKENLPKLITSLNTDYYYNSEVNIITSESINDTVSFMNGNDEVIKTAFEQKLRMSVYSTNLTK